MSITTHNFPFFFKNIQKSHAAISAYLDAFSDGPYDFLFFQEIQGKSYHHVADINSPKGIEVFGIPIHPEWTCLPSPAQNSQVAVYYHWHITMCFHVAVNHGIFHHPNILLLSLHNPADSLMLHFINIYQNTNCGAPGHLWNAVQCLLQFCPCSPQCSLFREILTSIAHIGTWTLSMMILWDGQSSMPLLLLVFLW